ncbi:MAG: hypothetical protein MJ157_06395, partial [Clostridia bacterium]|nr:hypothetical protein [Clostridia bacterium]
GGLGFGLFFLPVKLLYQMGWLLGAAAALKTGVWLVRMIWRRADLADWKSGFALWAVGLVVVTSLLQAFIAPFWVQQILKLV